MSEHNKRPLEDSDQTEQLIQARRLRVLPESVPPHVLPDSEPSPSSHSGRHPSSFHTRSSTLAPPAPSHTSIQLRFQLARFKGVYRIARLPLSFTFAHLYRYILLLFGWSGMHLHQAEVHTHVELYAPRNRPGEIKRSRNARVPPEPDRRKDFKAWGAWLLACGRTEVRPVGGEDDPEDPEDQLWESMNAKTMKDEDVTLGDVWDPDLDVNISKGCCNNEEIAIKFEYDGWEVYITLTPDKNGKYMWRGERPQNRPKLITAKGAPPSEDSVSYRKDIEPKKKKVPDLLFADDTFERYLKGEIRSAICNTELSVYEAGEVPQAVVEAETEEDDDWEGPRFCDGELSDYEP